MISFGMGSSICLKSSADVWDKLMISQVSVYPRGGGCLPLVPRSEGWTSGPGDTHTHGHRHTHPWTPHHGQQAVGTHPTGMLSCLS